MDEATRSVERANIAASQAKDAALRANAATDAAREKADVITGHFDKIDSRIDNAIAKIESEIVGATASVRALATKTVNELQTQLGGVETQVAALSRKANINADDFDKQQKALREAAESTQRKFSENAKFTVMVRAVGAEFVAEWF